jgi:hypothetical protein
MHLHPDVRHGLAQPAIVWCSDHILQGSEPRLLHSNFAFCLQKPFTTLTNFSKKGRTR